MRILLAIILYSCCFAALYSCGFDKQIYYKPKETDSLYHDDIKIFDDSVFSCMVSSEIFIDNASPAITFGFNNKKHSTFFITDIQGSFDSVSIGHKMVALNCKLIDFTTGRKIITDYFRRNMILDTSLNGSFRSIPDQYRQMNDTCCSYDIEMKDTSKTIVDKHPRRILMHLYFKVDGENGYTATVNKTYILYKKKEYDFWILRDD